MRDAKTIIAQNAKLANPFPEPELTKEYIPVDPAGGVKIYENAEGKVVNALNKEKELIDMKESDESKHYPVADFNAVDNFKDGLTADGSSFAYGIKQTTLNGTDIRYYFANLNDSLASLKTLKFVVSLQLSTGQVLSSGEFTVLCGSSFDMKVVAIHQASDYLYRIIQEYNPTTKNIYLGVRVRTTGALSGNVLKIRLLDVDDTAIFMDITPESSMALTGYTRTELSPLTDFYKLTTGDDADDISQANVDARLSSAEKAEIEAKIDLIADNTSDSVTKTGAWSETLEFLRLDLSGTGRVVFELNVDLTVTPVTDQEFHMNFNIYVDTLDIRNIFLISWEDPEDRVEDIGILHKDSDSCFFQFVHAVDPGDSAEFKVSVTVGEGNIDDISIPFTENPSIAGYDITIFGLEDLNLQAVRNDVEDSYSAEKELTQKTIDGDPSKTNPNILKNILIIDQFTVNYDDASPLKLLDATNLLVVGCHVEIETAWNGTQINNTLMIGDEDDNNGFILDLGGSGKDVLSTIGFKTESIEDFMGAYLFDSSKLKHKHYGSTSKEIRATISKDASCTQGIAKIYLMYYKLA